MTSRLALGFGIVFLVFFVNAVIFSDYFSYTVTYGEIENKIHPFAKLIVDNQVKITFGMILVAVLIIAFRWQKFTKNTKKSIKYLNKFIQKM
jgi:hypothetical protein